MSSSTMMTIMMAHDTICSARHEFMYHPPKSEPDELSEGQDSEYDGAETTSQAFTIFFGIILLLLALMVAAVAVIGIAMGIAAICGI